MSAHVMVRALFLQRTQFIVGRTWTLKTRAKKNKCQSTELSFVKKEKNVPYRLNSNVGSSLFLTSGRGAVNWDQGSCTLRGLIK